MWKLVPKVEQSKVEYLKLRMLSKGCRVYIGRVLRKKLANYQRKCWFNIYQHEKKPYLLLLQFTQNPIEHSRAVSGGCVWLPKYLFAKYMKLGEIKEIRPEIDNGNLIIDLRILKNKEG